MQKIPKTIPLGLMTAGMIDMQLDLGTDEMKTVGKEWPLIPNNVRQGTPYAIPNSVR